ncbi:hypothetical protein BDV26DRAFT_264606, partial [Aspergillus bertholletiae]
MLLEYQCLATYRKAQLFISQEVLYLSAIAGHCCRVVAVAFLLPRPTNSFYGD